MKKIFLFSTIIIFASFILSCSEETKEAYYRFTSQDNKRLLSYSEGQVLKFYNQNNEERTFTIGGISTIKNQYTVGMGFFTSASSYYFYYDSKSINLFDSKMEQLFRIYFQRWPLNTDLAKENKYTEYPSKFSGTISWRFWNGDYLSVDYEQIKIEMSVNGKTYKNVFVLNSGNDSIIDVYRDVNVIYYDETEGIIGFDDLNGNEWRLSN